MTDEPPQAMPEDYWENVANDGGEPVTPLDLVRACVETLDEPEELLAAVLTGESGSNLFVLAWTRKVRDGNLILTLRYVTVDRDDLDATTGQNRIRMRVQGSLLPALKVVPAAIRDENATPDDPMLLDARNADGLDHTGRALSTPVGSDEQDQPDESDDDPAQDLGDDGDRPGRDRGPKDPKASVTGDESETVRCQKCGERIPREEAVNFGSAGIGADAWVHEGGCPE